MTLPAKPPLSSEQLLAEFADLLRTMPDITKLYQENMENVSWLGRASALIERWDSPKMIYFRGAILKLRSPMSIQSMDGAMDIVTIIQQAAHDLRLSTTGPSGSFIEGNKPFAYYDEIRKIILTASSDILFVDPYLDDGFVVRYLPVVKGGVNIRLLTSSNKISALLPAVQIYSKQEQRSVLVRQDNSFHDRYLIVDGINGYQSGASFKDGGANSPTTLTQFTDIFDSVKAIYEAKWQAGKVLL